MFCFGISSYIYHNPRGLTCDIPHYEIKTGKLGINFLSYQKSHDIALIVGTGESVRQITHEQSIYLMNTTDIWGINQMFFHDYIVPKFYHVEMANLGRYGNKHMWNYFILYKKYLYNSTTFITPSNMRHNLYDMLCKSKPLPMAVVSYTLKDYFADYHGCTQSRMATLTSSNTYNNVNNVDSYCSATITRVLGLIIRLKYKNVAFIGVDLTSTTHFYSNHPFLTGNVRKFETLILEKDTKKYNSSIHATGARGVHLLINKAAQLFTHIKFYNLANNSKLTDLSHVTTISINSFVRKYYVH